MTKRFLTHEMHPQGSNAPTRTGCISQYARRIMPTYVPTQLETLRTSSIHIVMYGLSRGMNVKCKFNTLPWLKFVQQMNERRFEKLISLTSLLSKKKNGSKILKIMQITWILLCCNFFFFDLFGARIVKFKNGKQKCPKPIYRCFLNWWNANEGISRLTIKLLDSCIIGFEKTQNMNEFWHLIRHQRLKKPHFAPIFMLQDPFWTIFILLIHLTWIFEARLSRDANIIYLSI